MSTLFVHDSFTVGNYKKVFAIARERGRAAILTAVALAASATIGACSSSMTTTPPDAATTPSDLATPVPAAAFFRGTLAATVAASKAMSDPFFMGVQGMAIGAGDNGHDALLGTTHLGTTLNQFVGLDTWSSAANMDAVYSDPHVTAFGAAFYAAPPEFKTFFVSNFYQWGNTDSGDTATPPHYFVMVRGRFKSAPDQVKAIHDPIAQGAEAGAKTAGEVAHIVYYGRQDPLDALIVDIWSQDSNIDSFYSNPQFKSALSSLFDSSGPNFGVYNSTDWVTW